MLLVAAVSGAACWGLGSRVTSPEEAAARALPPEASPITAAVELRELSQSVVLRGTVSGGAEVDVFAEPAVSDARVVVTRPALPPGTAVRAGDRLVEVSGRPVFALAGEVPMYRDLRPGVEGDDVAALQEALRELGFDSWDPAGRFGESTESAVRRFYQEREYRPVVEEVPAEAGPGAPTAGAGSGAEPVPEPVEQVVVPVSELVFVPRLPTVVTAAHAAVGQQPAGPVLSLSAGELAVRAPVTGSDREVLATGTPAVVTTASGAEFAGTVTGIGPVGQPAEEAGAEPGNEAGHQVVVAGAEPIDPALLGEEAAITVEIAATGEPVLAVPLAAVWSTADGTTQVTVLGPGDRQTHLRVTVGMSAEGFVELTDVDGELRGGDLVLVGQERSR
jgi:peptidoglycan hydrolase-like protein with peptidoglycan-binding domain